MTGRYRWHILTGALACLAQAGCQSFALVSPTAPDGAAAAKAGDELPPNEKSRLCLTAAEQMEKGGKVAEAIQLYEKARQTDPKLQVSRRLAVLHDKQGDFVKSQQEYEVALALSPQNADLLNDLGYSYYSRGRWEDAEKYLRQALASNPKHGRAWINLGMVLGQKERYDESIQAFQKVVSPAQAQCNLAFLLTTQGKRAEAIAAYRRALAVEPELQLARLAMEKLQNPSPPKTDRQDTAERVRQERREALAARTRVDPAVAPATPGYGIVHFEDDPEAPTTGPSGFTPPALSREEGLKGTEAPRATTSDRPSFDWHEPAGATWKPRS